jgi:stearoyl-CoA desaturase (delta-9 desaturase)
MPYVIALGAALVTLIITNLATTIYLHRGLTHRSLTVRNPLRFLFRTHLWLTTGIRSRDWVAVHRKHHRFADEDGDPHSPNTHGWGNVLMLGFFICAKETRNPETIAKYSADIRDDGWDRWVFNHTWIGFFIGWTLFGLACGWLPGSLAFLFHGASYLWLNGAINSFCHVFGYKNYSRHQATNLRVLAFLCWGEGYHNNHHEYPNSPSFQATKTEWDPCWWSLRIFSRLRQIRILVPPIRSRVTKLAARV